VKAIVCYKCGSPTAEGPEVSRRPATPRIRPRVVVLLLAIGALTAVLWAMFK